MEHNNHLTPVPEDDNKNRDEMNASETTRMSVEFNGGTEESLPDEVTGAEETSELSDFSDSARELCSEELLNESAESLIAESDASSSQADMVMEMEEKIHQAEAEAQREEEDSEEIHEPEIDYSALPKAELLQLLETAVKADDISKTKNQIAQIKVEFLKKIREEKQAQYDKFLAEGGKKEDFKPVTDKTEERFHELFEIYKAKKTAYTEQLERQKLENLAAKQKILEELKALVNSEETLKKTYDEFRRLQERWKEIGPVPRNENNNLWQNYHFLVEKFFDKVKINKELKDLDLRKNLEQKIQLCEKAEELLLSPSIHRSFKLLQRYHEEWKEIGPVPPDKSEEIWERFKTVSDRINAQRREYYNKLQQEQENNYIAKNALCEKLENINTEELTTVQAWKARTEEVDEMIKLWQTIGRTSPKTNEEIWQRFKKGVNQFYAARKEFFNALKEQQINNYNIKLNLCVQAEAMINTTNWKKSQAELLKLQEEWKKTGPVPRKYSDKIWKRFRAACDAFFEAKSKYYSNITQMEQENLNKKLELIKQIEEYQVADDKAANLEALHNFQRAWMEIGHVPILQKDKLQNDFRNAINKLLDRLKISSIEAGTLTYKTKLESLKAAPDGNKALARERNFLENKIAKLQNDINLWENNIGFLASSKNADLLKEEFAKKIKSAKEELELAKAKLKLLKK